MAFGTVKLYLASRRYGFIRDDAGGADIFVHYSMVNCAGLQMLRKGQRVCFDIYDNAGRLAARNLRLVTHGPNQTAGGEAKGLVPDKREMRRRDEVEGEQDRKLVERAELEQLLTDAVKSSHADCSEFVGVIVERIDEVPTGGANWDIKGVKYGRANTDRCNAALRFCAFDAQHKYDVADDDDVRA